MDESQQSPNALSHDVRLFVPPGDKTIEQFARDVCSVLVKQGRSEFASNEVRRGIASFLKLIAEITSKQMNTK